ncbi:MAE_28990/MAE_18760 family HEPN-like nuclease [Methanococcoides sp. NM1]|uniref:MAE_28990/MAE_18760 family HEPN-like nuclease n=1 Tax=Methanococcoides sp. NM1 TaxID=1201013 RepID=UPI001083CB4B|nr:MAE_28990/MAE_18760 family HEPN-like nuclease [Methanococcoides sp. NM1]
MNIKSREELFKYLDVDISWRKKEITHLKNNVVLSSDIEKPFHIKIGVAFLYAHWQGYISNAGNWYINYIKNRCLKYEELNDNLITLALRSQIKTCWNTTKIKTHHQLVNTILNDLSLEAPLPHEKAIDSTSNLKYDILEDILFTLGLDATPYQLNKNLINKTLLDTRNKIVHGDQFDLKDLDEKSYLKLHNEVLGMIELFKSQITSAVETEAYKKNNLA